jgi:hypothetical protein
MKSERYVDIFCEKLDKIFQDGHPTKAQIIDAFHKTNPLSLSNAKWEAFRHPEIRYKKDTECFDDSGYIIFVGDIVKVICHGGPNYYQVLPMTKGSFKIKQLDLTPDEIEHYGENITDLAWLMNSYMGKYVILKEEPDFEKWLYRCAVGF